MSADQNQIVGKICFVCGLDVARRPRTKDALGRYFCNACYEQLRNTIVNTAAPLDSSAHPSNGVVSETISRCVVTQQETAGPIIQAQRLWTQPEIRQEIRKTNWLIVTAIFAGIFIPPVGIPLQIVCVKRLLKLAGRSMQWRWIIPAALPMVGLIPVKLMADRAGKVVHKPLDRIKPFDSAQLSEYRWLLTVQWCGSIVVFVPWIVGKVAGDLYDNLPWLSVFLLIDLAGLILLIYANVRLTPYRKVLRQAGGQRIWFSDSSKVERDWTRKELNRVPNLQEGA